MCGVIIISHKCTIYDNHMIYGFWDMRHEKQNCLSFWTIFCSDTPITTQKIKIEKNWKKWLEISSFYTSATKVMIICQCCKWGFLECPVTFLSKRSKDYWEQGVVGPSLKTPNEGPGSKSWKKFNLEGFKIWIWTN